MASLASRDSISALVNEKKKKVEESDPRRANSESEEADAYTLIPGRCPGSQQSRRSTPCPTCCSISTRTLDHLVHLVPAGALTEAVERFTALGFQVIPGGTHADGLTSNALIVLRDGSYVELITFNSPQPVDKHRWGHEEPGWIDWAFLGLSSELSDILNARSSNIKYLATVPGGRERPDGRILKWRITAPDPRTFKPAALPFFCGDVTPREWRVPLDPPSNAEHPNGVVGVAHVQLLTAPENVGALSERLTAVLGVQPNEDGSWDLELLGAGAAKLIVSGADGSWLTDRGREVAVYEIAFRVKGGNAKEGVQESPWGRIVFVR
ncbi:hypothetical protein AURDEDRAFT_151673 [Auricularia subglabra TFB-10046 SS5]|nr:hypothetical protein AURDEDRAFT_151673 [Auricularia subglabra TFB-10046 SS5]